MICNWCWSSLSHSWWSTLNSGIFHLPHWSPRLSFWRTLHAPGQINCFPDRHLCLHAKRNESNSDYVCCCTFSVPPLPPLFLALFRCLYSGDSARWGNTPVPALGTVVHFRGLCSQILPSGLMAVALNNIHFSFPSEHPPRPPVSIRHDERCGRQSSYLYTLFLPLRSHWCFIKGPAISHQWSWHTGWNGWWQFGLKCTLLTVSRSCTCPSLLTKKKVILVQKRWGFIHHCEMKLC